MRQAPEAAAGYAAVATSSSLTPMVPGDPATSPLRNYTTILKEKTMHDIDRTMTEIEPEMDEFETDEFETG